MSLIHLLLITKAPYPTVRPAVTFLYGKYLPKYGVQSTLVSHATKEVDKQNVKWDGGGELMLFTSRSRSRIKDRLQRIFHDVKALRNVYERYDAIVIRDKILTSLYALLVAKRCNIPFIYWMTYPFPEDDLLRVRVQGLSLGFIRLIYKWLRGHLTKWLLYRLLLPRCDHIFVISDQMKKELIERGIPVDKMTPDPMGVDMELIERIPQSDLKDFRLSGRKIIVYLGALDRTRRIDFFFEVLNQVRREEPNALLLLVGDTEEAADREWLLRRAEEVGVADAVVLTGWLPRDQAWQYVKQADVGVCALPSDYIFDTMSPTKVVEFLALGIPIVVNEHPEQAKLVMESKCGFSTSYDAWDFSKAILKILGDPKRARKMGERGKDYIRKTRSYDAIARDMAPLYKKILAEMKPTTK
ncbi:MAG: glycosyltransferase family 4 protein [Candidatus Hodarchaeota archaeon]